MSVTKAVERSCPTPIPITNIDIRTIKVMKYLNLVLKYNAEYSLINDKEEHSDINREDLQAAYSEGATHNTWRGDFAHRTL
jgi:hypothetical protein